MAVLLVEDVCDLIKDEKDRQYSNTEIALLLELSRIEDEAARKEKIDHPVGPYSTGAVKKGSVDMIVNRNDLKKTLADLLTLMNAA